MTGSDNSAAKAVPTGRTRRFWLRAVLAVVLVLILVIGAAWVRLYAAPLPLPAGLQERIESRIDGAMAAASIAIGDMVLALPEGGRSPALEFRDVTLTAPSGEVRAAFPTLRFRVEPGPLLSGQMRVRRAVISGAGLNLNRSPEGRFGIDFAGAAAPEAEPSDLSLSDTLARLDTMFSGEVFSTLEEIRGESLEVVLSDAQTGRDMRLHGAEMRLQRRDGRLELEVGGELEGSRDARLQINLTRDSEAALSEISMEFDTLAARDLAASTPALSWLDLMRAPIDGQLSAILADDGTVGALNGWLDIGAGHISLPGTADPIGFDAMEAALSYDPDTRRVAFDGLALEAEQLSFVSDGYADVSPDGSVYVGQFTLREILVDPEDMFEEGLSIDGAALDLRLTLAEEVRLEIGQAAIHQGALRAMVSGHAVAGADGVTLAVDAHLVQADLPTILSYWPATAIPNTRWWITERLRTADASGVDFSYRQRPGAEPIYELGFDFTGAEIIALPAAPPITGGQGFLNLQGQQLVVGLDAGEIAAEGHGGVALAGSRMMIGDVSVFGPRAHFDLAVNGSVPDVMHLLAGAPFSVLDASGYQPDEIGTGQMQGTIDLALDLVDRPPDAGFDGLDIVVDATVTDFRSETLVPDRLLTAQRMQVDMTSDQLTIGGQAALDTVPLTGQWSVLLDPDAPPGSRVDARAVLTRASLSRFGVELPDWLISGEGAADITVQLRRNQPAVMNIRSDLAGVGLSIPSLAWRMTPARTGNLEANIRLGPNPAVTDLTLEGSGLTLEGAVSFTADGWLDRLTASRFRVGQWLDVRGSLIGRRNQSPAIEVAGGVLDFRTMPSLANTSGSSGDVGPLDISLNTMQITSGISLTDLRADLDGASMSGNFRGLVNGAVQVTGQLVPSPNGPSVRLQSSDGGAVMRAADIFENMHGGQFDLILAARPEDGQYDGRLTVDGPRLRNAPAMAELLNLISVVGLLEQLGGEGINMGEVDARFRITPQRIILEEGTAVGPSMGISMDGVYDVASEQFQMQGVISPLYFVNGMFGALFATRRRGVVRVQLPAEL